MIVDPPIYSPKIKEFFTPAPVDQRPIIESRWEKILYPTLASLGANSWINTVTNLDRIDAKNASKNTDNQLLSLFKQDPETTLNILQQPQFANHRQRLAKIIPEQIKKDPDLNYQWRKVGPKIYDDSLNFRFRPKQEPKIKPAEDYAFASAEQEIQQIVANPIGTAKAVGHELGKIGVGAGLITHAQLVGDLLKIHPLAAAAAGGAMLFGEPFYNQLRQQEYQLQALSHPEYILKQKVDSHLKNALLTKAVPLISKPLVAFGHAFGLVDFIDLPHPYDPRVNVLTPVFKPTRWLNLAPARKIDSFIAKRKKRLKGKHDSLVVGLDRYSHQLKARKRHSLLGWALYPFTLLGGAAAEVLLAYLETRAPGLASFLQGYVGAGLRGIFSLNTVLSGWGTSVLLKDIPVLNQNLNLLGVNLPVSAWAGGTLGWYYQTLLNLANNTQSVPLYMFNNTALPSMNHLRMELMPKYYESIFGPEYWKNPVAMDHFAENMGRMEPGTQLFGQAGTANYSFLNARNLGTPGGLLDRLFSKPAQFLFKHQWLQALPLNGFMLGPILGLPFLGREHLMLMAGDTILKLMSAYPSLNRIKNSFLWGAAAGGEFGFLTGGNIINSALIGGSLGAGAQLLNLLGTWEIPAMEFGGKYVYDSSFSRMVAAENTFMADGRPLQAGQIYRPTANFLEVANRGDYLIDRLPSSRFFNNSFTRGILSRLNGDLGAWGKSGPSLRLFNGGFGGALVGMQVAALFGAPLWVGIAGGAVAGIGAQALWEKAMLKIAAPVAEKLGNIVRIFGKILSPLAFIQSMSLAMESFGSFVAKPSWGSLGWTALGSVLAVSALAAFVELPVAILIVGTGLVIEGIARLFGYSVIGWINQNIFRPAMSWIGKTIGSLAGGALNFLSQAANAVIGFAFGVLQALMAGDIPGQIAGLTAAAVSIGMVGTTIVTMIAGGAFFTSASEFIKQVAGGIAYLRAEKEVSIPEPTNITTATYTLNYSYPSAELDSEGNPVSDPLTNVSITDTFVSPINFKTTDFDIVSSSVPAREVAPSSIMFNNLPPLSPGDSNTITLTVNFREPLDKLLATSIYNASSLCNRAELKTSGPQRNTNTTCINVSGGTSDQDAVTAATNLSELLQQCYYQPSNWNKSCGAIDFVTKKDFQVEGEFNPKNPPCPNPYADTLAGCKATLMPNLGIIEVAISKVSESAIANNFLTPEGFVNAVAAQLGQNEFIYNQACTQNYQPVNKNDALAGDIVTGSQGVVGIATQISSGQLQIITVDRQGRMQTINSSVNLVGQILQYDPNYHCPVVN